MTIDEIIQGESKNVEFKVSLPEKSEKYIKTIIAFANTQGGKLVVGVDDKTHKVVGIDDDTLFKTMDAIANGVSDSCLPQIVPTIEPQTIDGKTVIVITVLPGLCRPYFLKSKGKNEGTYIRVAGTTRPAQENKIKELEMEGARVSWDELICVDYKVTKKSIDKLCKDIMNYREKAGLTKRKVTKTQLVNWKLIKENDKDCFASNAFVLLTSDYFEFSTTQCAVFKGTERNIFLDKREFTGPLYEQIEEATKFVLRNIRLGAVIESLVRNESYELPVEAIREMIINAHCHRNLQDESCVQVALYDDRLEVTSPGGLYNGLTYEELINGHSKIRNRAIANVFNQMGLVEAWGTGIRRIIEAARDYDLPAPEFQAYDEMFRVNLYRKYNKIRDIHEKYHDGGNNDGNNGDNVGNDGGNNSEDVGNNTEIHDNKSDILKMIIRNNHITATAIAKKMSVSTRTIERNIKELKNDGYLKRQGSSHGGYWEVIKNR